MTNEEFSQKLKQLALLTTAYQELDKDHTGINHLHNKLVESLESLAQSPKGTTGSDCSNKWTAVKQYCKTHKSLYADFATITGKTTTAQRSATPSKDINLLELRQIAKGFPYFGSGNNCFDELPTNREKYQYKYASTRTGFLLGYVKNQLKKQAEAVGADPTYVDQLLLHYKRIASVYESAAASVKAIKDKASLLDASQADLQTIYTLLRSRDRAGNTIYVSVALINLTGGLSNPEPYRLAKAAIPEAVAYYAASFDVIAFWVSQSVNIERWKDQSPLPAELSTALQQWIGRHTTIEDAENALNYHEGLSEYTEAVNQLNILVEQYPLFQNEYTALGINAITADQLAGTRYETAYTSAITSYQQAAERLAVYRPKLAIYPKLQPIIPQITAYQTQKRTAYNSFWGTYKLGNPTADDQQQIEDLLRRIRNLKTQLAPITDWQNYLSRMSDVDLTVEETEWQGRLDEVRQLVTERTRWTNSLTTVDNVDGLALEPHTFATEGDSPIVRTNRVTIAASDASDGTNRTAPDDVDQGNLDDCYFLASLASMAQTPNFFYGGDNSVIEIIHPDRTRGRKAGEIDPRKIKYFAVKMYLPIPSKEQDPSTGRTPVKVLVAPTQDLVGRNPLEYAQRADSGELWVAIVEKAFAEIRGGYKFTEGGFPEEGFALLLNKSADDFTNINLTSVSNLQQLREQYNVEQDTTAVYHAIEEAVGRGARIAASTKAQAAILGAGGRALAQTSPNGDVAAYIGDATNQRILYGNHSYSIQGVNNNTIRLYNPHGGDPNNANYQIETSFAVSPTELIAFFDDIAIV